MRDADTATAVFPHHLLMPQVKMLIAADAATAIFASPLRRICFGDSTDLTIKPVSETTCIKGVATLKNKSVIFKCSPSRGLDLVIDQSINLAVGNGCPCNV